MIKTRKFGTLEELEIFLQGGVIGGVDLFKRSTAPGGQGLWGLVGATIVFTTPAATVTFTGTETLSVQDVISQIGTQTTSAVQPRLYRGRLVLIEASPSAGLVATSASTALPLLGFGDGGFSTSLINSDGSTSPYLITVQHTNDNFYFLATEE